MANPTIGSMKVDKILTQFSIAYRNTNYIGERVMPVIKVLQKTGKFAKYGKDNLRKQDNLERSPGTRARRFDYTVSQGSYVCTEKSLEHPVPDEAIANSDDPYNPKRDAAAFILDNIWLFQENALATAMADTAQIGNNVTLSGTDQWSDAANSDPLGDIKTARRAVKVATGQHPNVAVFGYDTWEAFKIHPDIVDRVKFVGTVSEAALRTAVAQLLEVEEILVGDAVMNTANEGQTESMSFVWGKHFWLLYRAPRPSIMMPSFGYTVKDVDRVADQYRDEATKSDIVRVADSYDQVIVDDDLCYLVKNAVA